MNILYINSEIAQYNVNTMIYDYIVKNIDGEVAENSR